MDSLVGYRFHPTPEELVSHFLKKKRLDPAFTDHTIKEVNIYEHHPCELPGRSFQSKEQFWYFFCILDQKYANSDRARRTAKGGSWKKTGKDLIVKTKDTNKHIGFRKTLVFYKGTNFKKQNKTNWVMHEYHAYHEDHRNKGSVFKREVVVCRIERKPDKNREPSSTLDEGQPSDSPVYDSGSNVTEDIVLKEEPDQLLQNHRQNTSLMEVETHPPPNHHISHLTTDMFQELEAQLLSNQYISSNGEDDTAKYVVPEMESQLLPNQYMSPIIGDDVAKYIFPELESQLLPKEHVCPFIEDHVGKPIITQLESQLLQLPNFHGSSTIEDPLTNNSFSEMETHLLPNEHTSSNFEDYVAKSVSSELLVNHQLSSNVEDNAAKSLLSEVRSLVPAQQDELVVCNSLDNNSFATLQSPLYIMPGSSYSTTFSNDLDPLLNQNSLSAQQSPFHLPPGCLYYGSSSNNSINGLHPNFFSTLQAELSDPSGFSNYSTNGLDHNSFSALQFPIRPLPEFSYSVNGLDHISAGQSPVYTPPGSSYSSWFSNDSNVWTPQFAAELEDDLANSHWLAQEDFH